MVGIVENMEHLTIQIQLFIGRKSTADIEIQPQALIGIIGLIQFCKFFFDLFNGKVFRFHVIFLLFLSHGFFVSHPHRHSRLADSFLYVFIIVFFDSLYMNAFNYYDFIFIQ